jgi:hypothetical protein
MQEPSRTANAFLFVDPRRVVSPFPNDDTRSTDVQPSMRTRRQTCGSIGVIATLPRATQVVSAEAVTDPKGS